MTSVGAARAAPRRWSPGEYLDHTRVLNRSSRWLLSLASSIVFFWDPAIGRLSLVQVLRVGVHHDQHHYTAVRPLLGR